MQSALAFFALEKISNTVGESIRLPLGHELYSYKVEPDRVQVVILTARVTSSRGGLKITHRGLHGRLWHRTDTGGWVEDSPVSIEYKLDNVEIWTSSSKTQADRLASDAWAKLCYRPGNNVLPMDGPYGPNPSV